MAERQLLAVCRLPSVAWGGPRPEADIAASSELANLYCFDLAGGAPLALGSAWHRPVHKRNAQAIFSTPQGRISADEIS